MKTPRIVALLLALSASSVLAQTVETGDPKDFPVSIAAARCAYTPTNTSCGGTSDSGQSQSNLEGQEPGANVMVAQRPRGMPGSPPMPRRPMPYPGPYSRVGMGSGRHAAIGAAIGFGLGAAIGAKASSNQGGPAVKASVFVGLFGAAIGAAVGSMPSFTAQNRIRNPRRRDHRRHRRFDEEDEMASGTKVVEPGTTSRPQQNIATGQ